MAAFTLYSEEREYREAIDESLANHGRVGEFSIEHTADGRAIFVSPQAGQDLVGFYTPCYNKERARELALDGVVVFDANKLFESLPSEAKRNFLFQIETESEENTLVDELVLNLEFSKEDPSKLWSLPILYFCLNPLILQPLETNIIRTAKRPDIQITINTSNTLIKY